MRSEHVQNRECLQNDDQDINIQQTVLVNAFMGCCNRRQTWPVEICWRPSLKISASTQCVNVCLQPASAAVATPNNFHMLSHTHDS